MGRRINLYLALITVILLAASIIVYLGQDHVAPVINVPEGELTYKEGQDDGVLLLGVTATDDKDDDLTGDVRIYDIAVLDNGNQAVVTYAVYDKSNNLGKATKLINYIAKEDGTKAENTEAALADETKDSESKDDASNDKTDDKKTTEEEATTEEEPEEGYDDPELVSDGSPVIRLSTHEVHIDVGGYFYIDSREYLYRNMYLDSVYDEYTPGVYELLYYCVDSDGNRSNDAKLKLYVGQEED